MTCSHPIQLKSGIIVPCGRCINCRIAHSREWAVRLMMETEQHPCSLYVTLTYDNEHLPEGYTLDPDELQRFWKRLRKRLGNQKIKYFACGEYGERFGRPHYHAIIFNMYFKQRKELSDAWPYGHNKVGTVTYNSCRYVADYIMKKQIGESADEYYGDRVHPFIRASNGLGLETAKRDLDQIIKGPGS